jgi:hypothetical protein
MSPLVFGSQQVDGLSLCQPAARFGMMFQDEIDERLADDHAHLGRLARMGAAVAATTLVNRDFRQRLQHQIPRAMG